MLESNIIETYSLVHTNGNFPYVMNVINNNDNPIISQYNKLSEQEMFQYFREKGILDMFLEQRQKAKN